MRNRVEQRAALLKQFAQHSEFVQGSITSVCAACNRAQCICRTKSSRRAYRLTYKNRQQKTQIVYVAQRRLPRMQELIANYARVRALMEKLLEANIAAFKEDRRA